MVPVSRGPITLHALIETQARRTPASTAVRFEGESLSYEELERFASGLALALEDAGAVAGGRIALFTERSLFMVVGLLGILKAAAAYVPVDPAYPSARVGFMMEDSAAALVVTQRSLLARVPPARRAVCVDELIGREAGRLTPVPASGSLDPAQLAYVVYTSGSTGQPKGVAVEHRNIVNYVLGVSERLRFEPGMHHALVSTVAADLGNTVLFPALATGGCLHVLSQDRAESPALAAEYFERERIDVLKITPSHLMALQAGQARRVMPRRRLILGGEACPLQHVKALRDAVPDCEIHNHYGPTETTVGVLTYRVPAELPRTESGTIPLGTPLPGCSAHVLDAACRPCQPGQTGELYIGGAGVARGYLNQPAITATKFIADPFDPAPGARLYRTGDLVRVLPDGGIEFCGRVDDQIKVAGHRVEPGEIEHALRSHAGVAQAVALARGEDRQIVAYIVPRRAGQPLWAHPSVHALADGAPVAHLNRSETDYLYKEIFVLQAYRRHGIRIADGDCIIDAGANIGLFTVFCNRVARGLRMLAFEPNPAAYACLQANADAWGEAVTCLPCGLGSEAGHADLTFFEGLSLLSGFHADAATERSVVEAYVRNQDAPAARDAGLARQVRELIDSRLHSRQVRAELRPLSEVMAEHAIERIDLLKVNVEKSELEVLRGIAAPDWAKIRQAVVEVDLRENLAPITALFTEHGFDVLAEQDPLLARTDLCYVYAVRPGEGRRLVREHTPLPAPNLRGADVLTPASLRRHIAERLPRHMVPEAFVLLDKLPLTANGKLDRKALPAPQQAQRGVRFIAPRSETEKVLAQMWAELLHVERVGVDDDFFDLGGKSLVAMRMIGRLREALGVDVPLRNLFERPTVAGLAEVVDGLAWASAGAGLPAGGQRDELTL